jgi:hypothetical protein
MIIIIKFTLAHQLGARAWYILFVLLYEVFIRSGLRCAPYYLTSYLTISSLEVTKVVYKCKHSVSAPQVAGLLRYKTSPSVISTEVISFIYLFIFYFCGNDTKDPFTLWTECKFLGTKPTSALAHFSLAET